MYSRKIWPAHRLSKYKLQRDLRPITNIMIPEIRIMKAKKMLKLPTSELIICPACDSVREIVKLDEACEVVKNEVSAIEEN